MTYLWGRVTDLGLNPYFAHSNSVRVVGMYHLPTPLFPQIEGGDNNTDIFSCLQPKFPGSKLCEDHSRCEGALELSIRTFDSNSTHLRRRWALLVVVLVVVVVMETAGCFPHPQK